MDVITCAIFGDCRLKGVGVVRGAILPSPIDLRCRLYNTAYSTVLPCDHTNIAYVITSTIFPHMPHLVKIGPGVTSPHIAKVTTHFFYFFCTQNFSTDLQLRPLNRF